MRRVERLNFSNASTGPLSTRLFAENCLKRHLNTSAARTATLLDRAPVCIPAMRLGGIPEEDVAVIVALLR
jgi:hypothetical protein